MSRAALALPLLLAACSDPAPIAEQACKSLPGLSVDPAGLAALEPLLIDEELAILKAAKPTRGQEKVGPEGLAALRAATTCKVLESASGGRSGWWVVEVSRTAPVVSADGVAGEPAETILEWEVLDKGRDLRVRTGLEKAISTRKEADTAADQKDFFRAAAVWRALSKSYPDPVLPVDVAWAEARDAAWVVGKKLEHALLGQDVDANVVGETSNPTETAVADVTVRFIFATDPESSAEAHTGPIPAGGKGEARAPIPDGFEGNVRMETADLAL